MSKESVKKISLMNRVVSLPAQIRFRDFENQIMFISLIMTRVSPSTSTKIAMDGNK